MLEAAIKRVSLGLRMELLHNLVDQDEPRRRADRLRLLLAHLDDAEVRDEKDDKRFGGPGAGFPYRRITEGDAVALDLGWMVGVEVPTKLDRTAAEWAEVRETVRNPTQMSHMSGKPVDGCETAPALLTGTFNLRSR